MVLPDAHNISPLRTFIVPGQLDQRTVSEKVVDPMYATYPVRVAIAISVFSYLNWPSAQLIFHESLNKWLASNMDFQDMPCIFMPPPIHAVPI